jgi:putative ABC transport system ATP-binding protein
MDPVIETKNIWKVYALGSSTVEAVRAASLRVERGEFIALMGPSGSGKSTLMHLLGCLDHPTRGTYRLEGREVGSLSRAQRSQVRNERIGFVFQAFNLLPRKTALENVALPLVYRAGRQALKPTDVQTRALNMLERVGLAGRAAHRPVELSGGERQRVAIARALAADPAIILADEPTGNLDSATGREIMDLLAGLSREGRTLVVVTHSPDVAAYAGRVVTMIDGRIQPEQSPLL